MVILPVSLSSEEDREPEAIVMLLEMEAEAMETSPELMIVEPEPEMLELRVPEVSSREVVAALVKPAWIAEAEVERVPEARLIA